MSAITVARVESKIQSFILGLLWCFFLAGALASMYHAAWWVASAHILLCFYVGWIGKNLKIHRGKSFGQLSQGVFVALPALTPDEPDDLSSEEMRHLVNTMVHVLYAVVLEVAIILLVAGTKFYWVLLIGIALFYVMLPFTGVVVVFMSINRLAHRHKSDDVVAHRPKSTKHLKQIASFLLAGGSAYSISFAADMLFARLFGLLPDTVWLPIATWSALGAILILAARKLADRRWLIAVPMVLVGLIAILGALPGSYPHIYLDATVLFLLAFLCWRTPV